MSFLRTYGLPHARHYSSITTTLPSTRRRLWSVSSPDTGRMLPHLTRFGVRLKPVPRKHEPHRAVSERHNVWDAEATKLKRTDDAARTPGAVHPHSHVRVGLSVEDVCYRQRQFSAGDASSAWDAALGELSRCPRVQHDEVVASL